MITVPKPSKPACSRPRSFLSLLSLSLCLIPGAAQGEIYDYSDGIGVIDVTQAPWNLDNTGVTDITADLQTLVDQTIPRKFLTSPEGYWPLIIYFPDGTYRFSDSVVGAILNNGTALGGLVIQGQSRDGVIFKLDDNAPGFADPLNPRIVLDYFAGNKTNNAFVNGLENVTLDIGSGNPGAIGLHFHANNVGAVRNVSIRSSDPEGAGHIGFQSQKDTFGPYFIKDLHVEGFDTGIVIGDSSVGRHGVTIDGLLMETQREAAIRQHNVILNIEGATSINSVPFINNPDGNALINLIDIDLQIPEDGNPVGAMVQTGGSPVFLRNITAPVQADLVSERGETILAQLAPDLEWRSADRNALWPETPDQSLGLPVLKTPAVEWFDSSQWAIVDGSLQGDDTEAIRKALHSGKPMIVFKPGSYSITDTIRIPPHVVRMAGQYAWLRLDGEFNGSGKPVFELVDSNQGTVLIERFLGRFATSLNPNPLILNAGNATLVLRDLFWVSGPVFRSEPTGSHVFIENIKSLPGSQNNSLEVPAYEIRGQSVWARQWNPEQLFPHAYIDGGQFWVFGNKTGETRGPIFHAVNHSDVEVMGISMNMTHDTLDIDPGDTVALISTESNVSANFIEMATFSGGKSGWGRHHHVVEETRNGETRRLLNDDPAVVHRTGFESERGAVMALYTGFYPEIQSEENQPPTITGWLANPSADGYSYTLHGSAADPDNSPADNPMLLWSREAGPGLARFSDVAGDEVTVSFDHAGTYQIKATASDGALTSAASLPIAVVPKHYTRSFGRRDVHRYLDNAPRDGLADLIQIAYLRVGDDSSNNKSDLKIEFPLRPFLGSGERINTAKLRLQIEEISGLEGLLSSFNFADSHGIADTEDFEAVRIPLPEVDLTGRQAGDWLELEIGEAIRTALQTDATYLTIWLAPRSLDDGQAEYVQFTSTVSIDESVRPNLDVRFVPPTLEDLFVPLGDAWYLHPTFGIFYDLGDWKYSISLGWLYTAIPGSQSSGMFAYAVDHGWLYLDDLLFPKYYAYGDNAWKMHE